MSEIRSITMREGDKLCVDFSPASGQSALEAWESRHLGPKYREMAREESRPELAERVQNQARHLKARAIELTEKRDEIKKLVDAANASNETFLRTENRRLIGERNKAESKCAMEVRERDVALERVVEMRKRADVAEAEAKRLVVALGARNKLRLEMRKRNEALLKEVQYLQATVRDYQNHPTLTLTQAPGTFTQSHEEATPHSHESSKVWNEGWEAHAKFVEHAKKEEDVEQKRLISSLQQIVEGYRAQPLALRNTPSEHLARIWDEGFSTARDTANAAGCFAAYATARETNPHRRNA